MNRAIHSLEEAGIQELLLIPVAETDVKRIRTQAEIGAAISFAQGPGIVVAVNGEVEAGKSLQP